jgi:hypothetical protein
VSLSTQVLVLVLVAAIHWQPAAVREAAATHSLDSVGVDFNGDGFGDLVVTAGMEDLDTLVDAGAVHVLYGSAAGVTDIGNQLWTQDSPDILDQAETRDLFGRYIAVGDFNGDAFSDLVVGAAYEDTGVADVGVLHTIYGSAEGLTSTGNQLWSQNSRGILDEGLRGERWGMPLYAGDFNGDGYDDLVASGQFEACVTVRKGGGVNVIYGSPTGLTATGNQYWTQDSPGNLDQCEEGDVFGYGQMAGDFNGDGFDDLAVGAYLEDLDTITNAGAVHVLYGSAAGLTDVGNQLWTQDSPGILDDAERGDEFGIHMGAGDLNGDGYDDLAVGVVKEDVGSVTDAGAVNVIYGSALGLTEVGNQFWTQDSPEILDQAELVDKFGRFPGGIGDLNGDGYDDIAIGAIGEDLDGIVDAGAVNVLFGSPTGLTEVGNQLWTQDNLGVEDDAEQGDQFGRISEDVDFNGDGFMDLTIGVGSETVNGFTAAGGVAILYSSAAGPTDVGNQFWTQDSPGILDDAEQDDNFGRWLLG